MKTHFVASILALTMVTAGQSAGQSWAQTAPTPSTPAPAAAPAAPPAPIAAPVAMEPIFEAKFKAADKAGTGFIEGPALEPYKAAMKQIDTNNDGKISRAEFATAVKAGIIN
jgi:EF hand